MCYKLAQESEKKNGRFFIYFFFFTLKMLNECLVDLLSLSDLEQNQEWKNVSVFVYKNVAIHLQIEINEYIWSLKLL